MRRVKLTLGYDGTRFAGWQRQQNALAVQQVVEETLGKLCREYITVVGAGRTDAGVHALGQVCHFDTETAIPDAKLPLALDAFLPADVRAYHAETVGDGFNARFCAAGKLYRYRIALGAHEPVLDRAFCWHVSRSLDIPLMREEARSILGSHNFHAFCATGSSAKTFDRTMFGAQVRCDGDYAEISVIGDHFLYNMVRILAGTLVEIGSGKLPRGTISRAITQGSRLILGQTAPAHGLILERVFYDKAEIMKEAEKL